MRQQIAHHRQCHASQPYEHNAPPLKKVGGHQHNNDVEDGNCNIERSQRVDQENRDRERRPLRRGEKMKWPMPTMAICLASRWTTRPDTWIIPQPKAGDSNDQQRLRGNSNRVVEDVRLSGGANCERTPGAHPDRLNKSQTKVLSSHRIWLSDASRNMVIRSALKSHLRGDCNAHGRQPCCCCRKPDNVPKSGDVS
jgi:hypothetical protein